MLSARFRSVCLALVCARAALAEEVTARVVDIFAESCRGEFTLCHFSETFPYSERSRGLAEVEFAKKYPTRHRRMYCVYPFPGTLIIPRGWALSVTLHSYSRHQPRHWDLSPLMALQPDDLHGLNAGRLVGWENPPPLMLMDDAGLKMLTRFTKLRTLHFPPAESLREVSLLLKFTELEALYVCQNWDGDFLSKPGVMAAIGGMKSLRSLTLQGCRVSDQTLASLSIVRKISVGDWSGIG